MENKFCKKNEAGINFKTKRKTKKKYLTPLILSFNSFSELEALHTEAEAEAALAILGMP
jgi:hypothetical protein